MVFDRLASETGEEEEGLGSMTLKIRLASWTFCALGWESERDEREGGGKQGKRESSTRRSGPEKDRARRRESCVLARLL